MSCTEFLSQGLSSLLDDEKCFAFVRQKRWPDKVLCTECKSHHIVQNGRDEVQKHRRRYLCKSCHKRFDDLTGTVFAGRHQSLKVWILCLYLMGMNLSNRQIAAELNLGQSDVQAMTENLRKGIEAKNPEPELDGIVEIDEVYVTAGHKGQPKEVEKKAARLADGG